MTSSNIVDVLFQRDAQVQPEASSEAFNFQPTPDPTEALDLRTEPEIGEEAAASFEDVTSLRRELEQLEDKMTCKICLDAEVDQLFLPCRHIICCVNCAKQVARRKYFRSKL